MIHLQVSQQLVEAAASLALGFAAGFFYDVLRVIRRRAGSTVVTWMTDLLFWVVIALALFMVGFTAGQGRQRVYMTVMSILAAVLYFCTLSRACTFLAGKAVDFFVLVIKIVTYPLRLILSVLKKFANFIKKVFQYWRRWYTIGIPIHARGRHKESSVKGGPYETQTGRYNYEARGLGAGRIRNSKSGRIMAEDGDGKTCTKRNNRRNRRAGKNKRRARI